MEATSAENQGPYVRVETVRLMAWWGRAVVSREE